MHRTYQCFNENRCHWCKGPSLQSWLLNSNRVAFKALAVWQRLVWSCRAQWVFKRHLQTGRVKKVQGRVWAPSGAEVRSGLVGAACSHPRPMVPPPWFQGRWGSRATGSSQH